MGRQNSLSKMTFVEPDTVERARERLDALKIELKDMEVQLASRNRTHPDGRRMEAQEYWEWRDKAAFAKACREQELIYLKRWLADNEQKTRDARTADLLHACYLILEQTEGLSDDEAQIVALARKHLWALGRLSRPPR